MVGMACKSFYLMDGLWTPIGGGAQKATTGKVERAVEKGKSKSLILYPPHIL